MYHMILLVVDDPNQCPSILDAWEAAGVAGITILESTGLGRVRDYGIRDDLPLMPSIADLFKGREHRHRTMFTVVESEGMVEKIIDVTEAIMGDLKQPHNGILFVLPVSRAIGIEGGQSRAKK